MKLKTILITACVMLMANYASAQVVYKKDGKIYLEFGKYNEYPKNSIDYKSKIRPGVAASDVADYWGGAITGPEGTNDKPYWKLEIIPDLEATIGTWARGMSSCATAHGKGRLPLQSEWGAMLMFRSQLADMGVTFTRAGIDNKTGLLPAMWLLNEHSTINGLMFYNTELYYTAANTKVNNGGARCVREVPVGE